MPKLLRITTAPLSLKYLLPGQMKFMHEHGFDVLMVSSDGPELADVIRNEGCRHEIVPMTRKMTPVADLKALFRLYRLIKKEKPDIIHSHTPKAGLLAMLAGKMAGTGIRVHTIAGLRFMTASGNARRIMIAMEKLTMRCATHVWPNSFSLQAYIVTHRLANKKKLEVIGLGSSNGIRLSRFNKTSLKPEKLEEIKRLVQYDPGLTYLLSVGRIVHDKGVDEMISAFSRSYENSPHLRLILVGSFEEELDPVSPATKRMMQTHPGIIMAGWNDAVEYFMSFSFALVHASHREGFPNVLLQAGAMECLVICSRIEGNIDIVTDQETGLMFGVRNAEELREKIDWAISHQNETAGYVKNLYHKVTSNFDQPVVHHQLLERYRELCNVTDQSAII